MYELNCSSLYNAIKDGDPAEIDFKVTNPHFESQQAAEDAWRQRCDGIFANFNGRVSIEPTICSEMSLSNMDKDESVQPGITHLSLS